jgi:hypothetical protein
MYPYLWTEIPSYMAGDEAVFTHPLWMENEDHDEVRTELKKAAAHLPSSRRSELPILFSDTYTMGGY